MKRLKLSLVGLILSTSGAKAGKLSFMASGDTDGCYVKRNNPLELDKCLRSQQ